jgi:hypothetical protein
VRRALLMRLVRLVRLVLLVQLALLVSLALLVPLAMLVPLVLLVLLLAPLAVCGQSALRRVSLVPMLVLVLELTVVLVLVQAPALGRKVLRWPTATCGLPGRARQEFQLLRERRSAHPRPPRRTMRRLPRTVRALVMPSDTGANLDSMALRTPDLRALRLRVLPLELTRPSSIGLRPLPLRPQSRAVPP